MFTMRTKLSQLTEEAIKATQNRGKLLFPLLSKNDVLQFEKWADDNYTPGAPIPDTWHPVVKNRCEKINLQHSKS